MPYRPETLRGLKQTLCALGPRDPTEVARTVFECLLWGYGSAVTCCSGRGSGCSRPGPLGEPLYENVLCCAVLSRFSCVQLFETPWTVAHQDPLAMGLSQYDAGVGCHFLLQRIFLTQRLKLRLLQHHHWQADSYPWLIFN